MTKPLTLPSLSHTQVTELQQLYDTAPNPDLWLRTQGESLRTSIRQYILAPAPR